MCPHFSITIRQRSKHQSAVAGAAYQSGTKLFSEYDGKTKNYSYKSHEVVTSEILLPSHAPPEYKNRETLWNAVEKIEGQWNSQLARCLIIALPREVPAAEHPALVRDYCTEQFVSKGMIADFTIHDKGDGNPHVHIMLTLRAFDENGKWLPKAKKVYDLDENGNRIPLPNGGYKSHKQNTVDWNDQKYAEIWRTAWSETANRYLEKAGCGERLDLRSYKRQEKEEVPTVHLGPAVSHMEEKGIQTELGDFNRTIIEHNRIMKTLKERLQRILEWLQDIKKKLTPLFEKEAYQPTLMDYFHEYDKQFPESRQSELYTAQILCWMRDSKLFTFEDLQKYAEVHQKEEALYSANQKRIKSLETALNHIDTWKKLTPLHTEYLRAMGKRKERFAEEHKTELADYSKAVRYFKAKEISPSDLDRIAAEREKLLTENNALNRQLRKAYYDTRFVVDLQKRVEAVMSKGIVPKKSSDNFVKGAQEMYRKSKEPQTAKPLIYRNSEKER